MGDEIQDALLSEAEKIAVQQPSRQSVVKRGKLLLRRRRLIGFVLSSLGLVSLVALTVGLFSIVTRAESPSDRRNDVSQQSSEVQGQVAVAVLQAIREVPQRWNRLFDYRGAVTTDGKWQASFDVRSCAYESGAMTCKKVGDMQVVAEATYDRVTIVDVSGAVSNDERATLVGYSTQPGELTPRFVFDQLQTIDAPTGRLIVTAAYWLGEVPTATRGDCLLQGIDVSGEVVMERSLDRVAPEEDGARDFLTMSEVPPDVVSLEPICSDWRKVETPSPTE